jgi:hypothetical protein
MDAAGSGGAPRRLLTPRRLIIAAVVVAGLAVVLVWFQPQKLIQDTRVDEAPPGAMEEGDGSMAEEEESMEEDDAMAKEDDAMAKEDDAMAKEDDAMMKDDAMTLAGSFRSIDHTTSGTATLALADDEHYYVRLEDFSTENGPDLFVYLSTAPASSEGREFAEDFIDLGALKGNIGNQNYLVPDGTDLEKYNSVVIWCRRFTSPFGAAPLESTK